MGNANQTFIDKCEANFFIFFFFKREIKLSLSFLKIDKVSMAGRLLHVENAMHCKFFKSAFVKLISILYIRGLLLHYDICEMGLTRVSLTTFKLLFKFLERVVPRHLRYLHLCLKVLSTAVFS